MRSGRETNADPGFSVPSSTDLLPREAGGAGTHLGVPASALPRGLGGVVRAAFAEEIGGACPRKRRRGGQPPPRGWRRGAAAASPAGEAPSATPVRPGAQDRGGARRAAGLCRGRPGARRGCSPTLPAPVAAAGRASRRRRPTAVVCQRGRRVPAAGGPRARPVT